MPRHDKTTRPLASDRQRAAEAVTIGLGVPTPRRCKVPGAHFHANTADGQCPEETK